MGSRCLCHAALSPDGPHHLCPGRLVGFVCSRAATLTRGGTADAPGEPESLALDTEVFLEPRDCIAFDEFTSHMEHTGWNAGDGLLILWEARLLDPNQPFTTYVNDLGTPQP